MADIPFSNAVRDGWTIASYALLCLAVVSLWLPRVTLLRAAFALAATLCGYIAGIVTPIGIVAMILFAIACGYYGRPIAGDSRSLKIAAGVTVWVGSLLLAMHWIPGFNNTTLVQDLRLSPASGPYTQWLNFDKTMVGLLLLAFCYRGLMTAAKEWREALLRAAPLILATIVILIGPGIALGFVRFDPKWNNYFLLWATVNLLFTCMAEEAVFRGLIQRELQGWLRHYRGGVAMAIAANAILFGLMHYRGGIHYVLLATVAGVGYSLVYRRTGRIEMSILTHFLVNATHFLLFTYPYAV